MFEISVPDFSKKGNSKDLVIEILTKEWPLSLKEIYAKCKKEFKYSGSYQSIFKAVNELLLKKVIVKKNKVYEINISWVKNLQSFTDVVETNYFSKNQMSGGTKNSDDLSILNFGSIFDAEKYLYYFVKTELKKMKDQNVVYEISNLWKVLFYYRAEYNYYTKLMKLGHKFLFFVSSNSDIENKAKTFYKNIGIRIKKKGDMIVDSIVFGDYYIQMFIPENLQRKIRELISCGDELGLLKVLDEDSNVKVIVHKDKELARGILEKVY